MLRSVLDAQRKDSPSEASIEPPPYFDEVELHDRLVTYENTELIFNNEVERPLIEIVDDNVLPYKEWLRIEDIKKLHEEGVLMAAWSTILSRYKSVKAFNAACGFTKRPKTTE